MKTAVGCRIGTYGIVELLGAGGMGEVYQRGLTAPTESADGTRMAVASVEFVREVWKISTNPSEPPVRLVGPRGDPMWTIQHRHLRHGLGRAPADDRDAVSRVLPCRLGRPGLHVHRQPQCQHFARRAVRSILVEWAKRSTIRQWSVGIGLLTFSCSFWARNAA
jgi:hypothetical protein